MFKDRTFLNENFIIKALKCIIDNPCKNNGDCVDLSGGDFGCTCKKGFTGADCGIGNFHKTTCLVINN